MEVEQFEEFFRQFYEKDLMAAAAQGKKSIVIDFSLLDKFDPNLADKLLNDPENILKAAKEALKGIDLPEGKIDIEPRFKNLPERYNIRIRNLRSEHIGKFICLDGVVRRASEVKPEVAFAIYECPDCGAKISVEQTERILKPPSICECGRRGGFNLIDRKLFDARWIFVEEPFEIVTGERPGEVSVYLKGDLTVPEMQRKTDPGNRLKINGIVKEIKKLFRGKLRTQMDIYVEANYVEPTEIEWEEVMITPEDEEKIKTLAKDSDVYNKIVASIAPSIYGMDKIKEAIALQLFGGVAHNLPDKTRIRGDIHILLIGDPSTGKSQLLKLISSIIPRGKYVGGRGASAAGLTATVVKDEEFGGGWMLEAGAMILANKGILCLHPETKLLVNDRIISIKDIFNDKNFEVAISNSELIEINDKSFNVNSFDEKTKSVYDAKAIGIRRKYYKGKLIKIKFNSGFELKLTPEHKLLDGNSLSWRSAKEFSNKDYVVAPLKLLSNKNEKLYIIDIIPDDWKICLSKEEKNELKKIILSKFNSLVEFNRKFGLNRHFLSGGKQISIRKFKEIMEYLQINNWKNKCFKFAKLHRRNRLRTPFLIPELGYVMGFIFGDGNVKITQKSSRISIIQSESHKKYINNLINFWKKVCEKPNIHSYLSKSKIKNREVISLCKQLYKGNRLLAEIYKNIVGEKLEKIFLLDNETLKAFIAGAMDSDGCISIKRSKRKNKEYKVVHVEFLLSKDKDVNLNFILALRRLDVYSKLIENKNVHRIRITGRKDIEILKSAIEKYSEKIRIKIPSKINLVSSTSDKLPLYLISDICENFNKINKSVLVQRGVWSTLYNYRKLKIQPSRDQIQKLTIRLKDFIDPKLETEIKTFLKRDFFLDKIKNIEEIDYEGYVYDIFVPEFHNFVANGVFVHNCVDEFDKMSKEDQIAMHEGLEQQQISIAKASIVATLPAQVSVLAGSNPKFFRFDPYKPIAEQVDIPDTLLSRFDLKFALKDTPNREMDEKLATHILETRLQPSRVEPLIKPEFLRKYIAYARKNCKPEMTREAAERLKSFYLDMRSLYSGESIAITLRQNEALMRLAEASAKIRLSNKVEIQDAERAIDIMKYSIQQLGYDYETGKLDIDRTEGVSASQRSKIHALLDIIDMLEKKLGKPIPKEEIIVAAEEQGIKASDTEELLRRLKSEGSIFEPKINYIERIR
ncbi:MAG: LAGLIDADG family homing endonuclease [Candidatus Aenigmatarchaeota archaeon]